MAKPHPNHLLKKRIEALEEKVTTLLQEMEQMKLKVPHITTQDFQVVLSMERELRITAENQLEAAMKHLTAERGMRVAAENLLKNCQERLETTKNNLKETENELEVVIRELHNERDLRIASDIRLRVFDSQLDMIEELTTFPGTEGQGACARDELETQENLSDVINDKDANGKTLLFRATDQGKAARVTELIQQGADGSITDNHGNTPLHIAAIQGRTDVCRALLSSRSVDVNARSKSQSTPLHYASMWGNGAVTTLLLESGADPKAKNYDGLTAKEVATRSGHWAVASLLPSS